MISPRKIISAAMFLLLAAVANAGFAQSMAHMPADLNKDSLARLPYLKRSDLDKAGQKIYDMLPGQSEGGMLKGPLAWAAYNPNVAKALLDLHNAAVGGGGLDDYARELAILVACKETHYSLEWNGHQQSALDAGISQALITRVHARGVVDGLDERDATIIKLGRQMLTERKVDSDTFAKAVQLFTQRGVMEMVAVMNTYAVSGFFAIAVDEHVPAGQDMLK